MFYEVFLILFGIYIDQTYHLPLFSVMINQLKKENYTDYFKKK